MRRAWKWVLVGVAVPAAAIAVLWIDSYYRAVAAIRAEDERLVQDLAAFRRRQKPGQPIDPSVEVVSLPCPLEVYRNPRARLEDGHSGHIDFYHGVWGGLFWLKQRDVPPVGIDQILTSLSITHQLLRECGYDSATVLHGYELAALREVPKALQRMKTPDDLRRFAQELDRRLESRPLFAETMEAEHLMNRAEVLRVLHRKENPSGFIVRPPGWREFFSWRIHLVKALKELDREIELLRSVQSASDREREGVLDLLSSEHSTRRTDTSVAAEYLPRRDSDQEALSYWTAARAATAIAIFRAEHGRDPVRLEELPRNFLLEPGGDRLSFKDGILTFRTDDAPAAFDWVIRPK